MVFTEAEHDSRGKTIAIRDSKGGSSTKIVVLFSLEDIIGHFEDSIKEIKNLFTVADLLSDIEDGRQGEHIWRAQIVFLSSALDFYMHELTQHGLCEIYEGRWIQSDQYKELKVKMEDLEQALENGKSIDWFFEYITENYWGEAMGSFHAVDRQLGLLGITMDAVAKEFHLSGKTMLYKKNRIQDILYDLSNRRNIIVHRSDRDASNAETKGITEETVKRLVTNVANIVTAINTAAKTRIKKNPQI